MARLCTAQLTDRGILAVTGDEARDFLQGLISNDIGQAAFDRAIYAALLTPQGKYLFDFFIIEHDEALLFDCEANRLTELVKRLSLYRLRAKVEFADRSDEFVVAALWGEGVADSLEISNMPGAARLLDAGVIYMDPRLSNAGARAILPAAAQLAPLEALGFTAMGAENYDRHRLTLGLPDGSRDLTVDKAILMECGFEELHGVDFEKGCFVGQELTARTKYRGLIRRRLLKVDVDGPLPGPGTPIMADGTETGEMRSGSGDMGLALLRLDRLAKAVVAGATLTAGDATITPVTPDWARLPETGPAS